MGQAPNRKSVVQQVSDADPERFRRAHTGQPGEDDWIKAVAAALHAEDPRWGLNGKRGDPNVLSLDVVTFRVGPTDRHVEAYDICGACGGGNPSVVWNDITNYDTMGQPGTAIWVKPDGVPGPVDPTPPPPPSTDVLAELRAIRADLVAMWALIDSVRILGEATHHEAFQAASRASEIKTLIENLPAGKPFPVYRGTTKAFGGSLTLTPQS